VKRENFRIERANPSELSPKMGSFLGIADASGSSQPEEIKPVQVFKKMIQSFSLCPLDVGVVPFPTLQVLERAKLAGGCGEPALVGQAAPGNHGSEPRASERVGLAAPLKILCGAGANLECLATREYRAAR
jgi:hypothetical protein